MAQQNHTTALSSGHPLSGERMLRLPTTEINEDTERAQLVRTTDNRAPSNSSTATQSFYHRNNATTNGNRISLSNSALTITSINIEGISAIKEELLADNMCRD
uniref:Uncharacterized protein n=1 Tax=Cacopsylla melanoneura TaxID=428564 RepID=A0A8D9BPZ8_9HEMI